MTQEDATLKQPPQQRETTLSELLGQGGRKVPWTMAVLATLGILVSSYLTYVHWSSSAALCVGVGDCEVVNQSIYSEISGVPIALLGLAMYVVILGGSIWLVTSPIEAPSRLLATLGVFGISLMGFLYSAYLTYVELFVLRAVCPWCVFSAALVSLILVLSARELAVASASTGS